MTRLKRRILAFFARLLFGRWADPINRVIESVQVAKPEVIMRSVLVRQAAILAYAYPAQFDSFFRRSQAFPDRYVFEFDQVVVLKDSGILLTLDGMILQESAGKMRRLFRHGDLLEGLTGSVHPLKLGHPCTYLPCKPFYHFLLEEVPALLYAWGQAEDLLVLVDPLETAPCYYSEALRLIFGTKAADRLIFIRGNVRTERYMLTQRDPFSAHIHPDDLQLLNRGLLHASFNGPVCRRMYISRRKAAGRRIENEAEVESLLTGLGYQTVCLEDFPLQEQIHLTANCESIVSPHGAGLSHLVWNPSLRKAVLEIFPSYVRNDSYASLARTLGHDYGYVVCDLKNGRETVDLARLETALAELGMA